MKKKINWKTPKLHDHETEDHHHSATWLELFFDLVFVSIISQISHILSAEISWTSAAQFIALFIPTWWAWIGSTFYNDRFDTDDISHRLFTFIKMVIVACMAYFAHHAFSDTFAAFTISYIAYRIVMLFLWIRAGYHNPSTRSVTNHYCRGFILAIILLIASLYVASPWRYMLWGIALTIEYATPLLAALYTVQLPPISRTHIPERFGLFMIIVLGESILAFVQGLSGNTKLGSGQLLTGFLGLILAFCIWWIYFDHINNRTIKKGRWWMAAWSYSHLPLVMSVAGIGAGIANIVPIIGKIPLEIIMLLCLCISVSLFTLAMIEMTLEFSQQTCCKHTSGKIYRFLGAFLAAICIFIPWPNPQLMLLSLISIMLFEIYIGFEDREHLEDEIGDN